MSGISSSDVLREILRRVPAGSLSRFRTVCKMWRDIIDDPFFMRTRANNQLFPTTILIQNSINTRLYCLSWDSLNYNNGQQTVDVIPVKKLYRTGVPRLYGLPVASCNGLILLSHYSNKKIWAIWNPLTREFRELPKPDADIYLLKGSGIGYDCASDDYKVVMILSKTVNKTCVYSLKLDSWRMIEDCPCDLPWCSLGVFVSGALHWTSYGGMIIALDLATESYRKMPLPPLPTRAGESFLIDVHALDGCLVVSYYYDMIGRVDGWVMNDYGMEESWMKLYSFGKEHITGYLGSLKPIAYLKSKGQVILQAHKQFIWLDIEKDSAKKVTIHGLTDSFSSQNFQGSLFRLDDSVAVAVKSTAGMKRKRKKKMKNASTRLKHSVTISDIKFK